MVEDDLGERLGAHFADFSEEIGLDRARGRHRTIAAEIRERIFAEIRQAPAPERDRIGEIMD